MTKRQRMLLNKAATDRKEHYKMYKSGGTWAFACIVLMTGIMWSAPLVHAQAAAADPVQSTLDTNLQSSGYNSGTDQENSSNVGTTNTGHSNNA
ncbi:KxYKxGKxW signal peptide domain-containing protein [Secundilactobacillus hailunensis]|uniref:KxYKxGKxW signal peptide domain-containing protein n=1 Tax=Secundilactobacillus hailunensis TaxID=2559923 RepID=A0ABW1TBD2_9LACO|nr:KxYKxGKxW signal peptide domain-containing protein [Secundilactobacillus hailunensis]